MIYALCPTYGRPELLRNSIACFLHQDYPASHCRLLICDDAGQLPAQVCGNVEVVSQQDRFPSITSKYNWMAQRALDNGAEILAVWEDDDVYLEHHLTAHSQALKNGLYSKPSRVLSTYGGTLKEEISGGLFHASVAFHRDAYLRVNGWPETNQANFDQQLLANLKQLIGESDTCHYGPPSYVFRWESTGHYHGQAHMKSDDDESWWDACKRDDLVPIPDWVATGKFDKETKSLYENGLAERLP